jgi:beta-N-acetylhexosaminidase
MRRRNSPITRSWRRRWTRWIAALWIIVASVAQTGALQAQLATPTPTPAEESEAARLDRLAAALVARMSPAERIGQLFVVTIHGREVENNDEFIELFHRLHIGGVVLSPRYGNFSNERGVDTPRQVATLTNQLQALAYGLVLPTEQALRPVPLAPWPPREGFTILPREEEQGAVPLPLLIGVYQAGDDLPMTALRRGFTPLPSPMALGASWNRDLVRSVGGVVGRELRAVGFNLLLGPNLDVFSLKSSNRLNALGIYSFGGDPYWVAQLGRAYIEGVHIGGGGRVATVAESFPGQGAADRVPNEEVASIQLSRSELQQNALPPFLAVTRQPSTVIDPAGDPGATDILMTSHMRYIGLQGGDGRGAPLSLAPELRTILRQEGVAEWQSRGGVVMSGPLGAPALRRYFETTNPENFRRVAQDAFVAGNDLLYLADLSLDGSWESQFRNIVETVSAFRSLYASDQDFAALVDESVRRIVRLKLGLHRDSIDRIAAASALDSGDALLQPVIPLSSLLVTDIDISALTGEERIAAEQQMAQIARSAITLLYPDPSTQTASVPPAFAPGDRILIFTDFRLQRECSTCEQEPSVDPDALARIIERLYGSQSAGVIDPNNIVSKTFVELSTLLDSLERNAASGTEAAPVVAPTATSPTSAGLLPTPTLAPSASPPAPTPTAVPAAPPDSPPQATPPPTALLDEIENTTAVADLSSKTLEAIANADWIIFAMLDVAPESAPNSAAVKRLLSSHAGLLTNQKTVVLALHAPFYLDATEMSKLTAYFGVYSKTTPFLESAVHALFRRYPPIGAPPVDVPGTRFASLAERLRPNPASQIPLVIEEGDGDVIARTGQQPEADDRPTIDAGALMRMRAGPVLDMNGHPVPDGVLVNFDLRYEGEDVALMLEPAPTRGGVAVREITLDRGGVLRVQARAEKATSRSISIVVLPPATPTTAPGASPNEGSPVGAPSEDPTLIRSPAPDRVNLLTLAIALFTMAVVLSLLLILQVRVLPRSVLVHNMLWATIFGLTGYILYGLGLFPGGGWLRSNIGMLSIPIVVFIPMLLPLLWLQLRSDGR